MGFDLLAVFTYVVIKDKLLDTASRLVQNYGRDPHTPLLIASFASQSLPLSNHKTSRNFYRPGSVTTPTGRTA